MRFKVKKEDKENFIKRFIDSYYSIVKDKDGNQKLYLEKDTVEEWLEYNLGGLEGEPIEATCKTPAIHQDTCLCNKEKPYTAPFCKYIGCQNTRKSKGKNKETNEPNYHAYCQQHRGTGPLSQKIEEIDVMEWARMHDESKGYYVILKKLNELTKEHNKRL